MNPSETGAATDVAVSDAMRLLRSLARKDAIATVTASGEATVGAPRRRTVVHPAAILRQACAAGWVAVSDAAAISLTRAGRAQLRRALSTPGQTAAPVGRERAEPPQRAQAPAIDLAESPLAWLARRQRGNGEPLLSPAQLLAGERFRADFWFAGMTPRVTSGWSGVGGGKRSRRTGGFTPAGQTDATLAARERIRLALAAVGPELSGILVDLCGHLKGLEQIERDANWPKRSAKLILDLALTALARHYGLIVTGPARTPHTRHWGAPDYRPPLERPAE